MDTEAAETVLEKGQNKEPIFDFAHCDKVESVTRDKRSRFSAGQHSSGYSSADYSDCCDGAQGISDSEFGTALRYEGDKKAYDASIARHHNVETDASSSSNSESSDDDKDEDEYRVERREERVLRSQPSQQPRLFSPISTLCEDNRFVWSKVLDANEAEGNAEETAEAEFAADGPATVEHTSSGYEIVKRKSAYLKLNHSVDFCKIQTVKYRHHHKKSIQHYKKNLRPEEKDIEGNIGLREGDLLLEVNGKSLVDRKQKRVVKIFQKIKPRQDDGNIYINLRYRRWEKRKTGLKEQEYEVDYELKLVLEPVFPYENEYERSLEREVGAGRESTEESTEETGEGCEPLRSRGSMQSRTSRTRRSRFKYRVSSEETIETNTTLLPKGNIDYIKSLGERKARIKCLACGPDEYLTASNDDTVALSAPLPATEKNEVFILKEFKGVDTSPEPLSYLIFCVRVQTSGDFGHKFVSSQLEKGSTALCLRTGVPKVKAPSDVDETCFIKREFGRQVLLESLLNRGHFIGCETKDGRTFKLEMVKKPYSDLIHDNNLGDAKFELFYTKDEYHEVLRETHHGTVERLVKRFAVWNEIHARNEEYN